MTDWSPRVLNLSLDFLRPGEHRADIWADSRDSNDPNHLEQQRHIVTSADTLALHLSAGGGQAIRLHPE
jgi:hypothetical protein